VAAIFIERRCENIEMTGTNISLKITSLKDLERYVTTVTLDAHGMVVGVHMRKKTPADYNYKHPSDIIAEV